LSRQDLPADVIKSQRKRLAQIYEQKLDNRERAVELYRETMQEPADPPPEDRDEILEELYRRQGVWDELIDLLTKRQGKTSESEELANLALEIADIQETKLDRDDLAFFELVRAIKHAPGHPKILDELFRLAHLSGYTTELLAVLDDHLATVDDQTKAQIHARAGQLLESGDDHDQARQRFVQALELDPTQPAAFVSLHAALLAAEEYENLVELDLRRAANISKHDEKIELLYEAAELLEEKIENDGRAADVYDRILSLEPESTAAIKANKRLRGEAALAASFTPESADQEDTGEVAEIYSPIPDEEDDRDDSEPDLSVAPDEGLQPADRSSTEPEQDPDDDVAEIVSKIPDDDDDDDSIAQIYSPPPEEDDEEDIPTAVEQVLPEIKTPAEAAASFEPDPFEDREATLVEAPPEAPDEAQPENNDRETTQVAPPPVAEDTSPAEEPEPGQAEEPLFDEADAEMDFIEGPEEEEFDTAPLEEEKTLPAAPGDPIDVMRQTLTEHPDAIETWDLLASALAEKDGSLAAFDALEEGLGRVSSDEIRSKLYRRMSLLAKTMELQMRLGILLEQRKLLDDAESSFRSVLREESANTGALDGLFRIYESRGSLDRYDAILTRTLKAATDPPTRRTLLFRRATLRANQLKRYREALEDLDQLVSANEEDLDSLTLMEEILERTGQHDELIKAYRRHLSICDSPDTRVDLHTAVANLYKNDLDDPDKAIDHYREALKENPDHLSVYDSLAELLEIKRDWLGAIETLRLAADRVQDPEMESQLRYRSGKILEEQLLRPEEAEVEYRQAVENLAPSFEALAALKSMARRRADWVELIRLGKQQIETIEDHEQRARLLEEQARIWRDKLDNEEKSLECFEKAYDLDPDSLEAARVVADARLKSRSHEEAHVLLERLTQLGAQGDLEEQELSTIYLKLAQTCEAIDRPEAAAEAFERAIELAPTDHKILTQYGYHLARCERWDRAVELHQEILDNYRHRLEPNEVADIHCLAAQGFAKLDNLDEANLHYHRALKANPRHLPALRASIELARKLGRYQDVAEQLKQLYELSSSPSTRYNLSVQIGDIYADELKHPDQAAKSYIQALEQEPNNIDLLEKLRRVQIRAERYEDAVKVLERLAHLSSSDRIRARYLRISGDIEQERLDDDKRALVFYLRALRAAPLDKRAHSSSIKILTRMRDWTQLTALYEDLYKRLPPPIAGQGDRRIPILTELVELYRYRVEDRKRAIKACEQLHSLDLTNIKTREDLARLYEADGRLDDSANVHRSLIADSPFSVDSYHALSRIYKHQGQRDHMLCMAATLGFLDEANEDELALLREQRHALPIPPGRRINESMYNRQLLFSQAGGLLGEMFSFAADFCRPLFVVDHRDFKLKPRERLKLSTVRSKIGSTFREAIGLLGGPEPEIYAKGANIKGIMAINTSPAAIIYSEEAVRRASIAELRFMVGRSVAFSRPENLLAAALSPMQLRWLLVALVELAFPGDQIHAIEPEAANLARKLGKLVPRAKLNRLHQLSAEYRKAADELSIRDWLEGVEHTCNRAGFVLCGDLEASVQVLKGARVVSPSGSNRSLIRELIFFSISEDYFGLRKSLKAAIS